MRVLHVIAAEGLAGADSRATAEVLLATMVTQDPELTIDELVLPVEAAAAPGPAEGARGRPAQVPPTGLPGEGQATLVESVLAADVIVLTVGMAAHQGRADSVRSMLAPLTRPDALLARAGARRSGRRVSRRMVLVAPPARDAQESRGLAELVLCVKAAFRSVDVGEFGVIAGGTADSGSAIAAGPQPPAAVRRLARARISHRKAS